MTDLPDLSSNNHVHRIICEAFREDLAEDGDATTRALVPPDALVRGCIVSRGSYVVSGVDVVKMAFREVDHGIHCDVKVPDGSRVAAGDNIIFIEGKAQGILTAERTALNFMQRMTGIATMTSAFVEKASPYGVRILDTRKTTPGLRMLEKYAVLCGGGSNHRMGLFDMIMIKDNHRRLWSIEHADDLGLAVETVRERCPDLPIEVEVETLDELRSALGSRPDWVLLDNMAPELMRECVKICNGACSIEASGGITLDNVEDAARAGVDAISLGCLTHSFSSADLSLELL